MNGHELTARFVAQTRWEALPQPVQAKARMCFADGLGATISGTLTRISSISAGYAAESWRGNEATILAHSPERGLHGVRASLAGAAFANGNASNALDLDDSTRYANGHGGASIFPTALAVGEGLGRTGADILAAIVVGYEVAHRIGRCWHASREVYQACGSWGSVACAAVAANLLRLSPEQAGHALGIAEYHAPNLPMMRDVAQPAMVKHGIGWAAMTGVMSAGLAARGYTGVPTLLALPEYQDWACDIGQDYLILEGVAWKAARYACCGWAHAGVEGARRLVEENHIDLDQIQTILVEGCQGADALFKGLPSTTEEAQFSQSWPLAAMLVDGEIGPAQILEARLADPAIRRVAAKVTTVESPEMQRLAELYARGDPKGRFASIVTITLKDGRSYSSGLVDGGLRFPQPGWDASRMDEKLRWMAQFVLDEARVDALSGLVWHFDELTGAADLIELLTNGEHRQKPPV